MAEVSRATITASMAPNQWVMVFQKEDQWGSPPHWYHGIDVFVQSDVSNTIPTAGAAQNSAILLRVEESENGTTWVQRQTPNEALGATMTVQPGGQIRFRTYHVRRFIRVLAYSNGQGTVRVTVTDPEAQILPALVQPPMQALTCSSWCEHDCETGTETTGDGTVT